MDLTCPENRHVEIQGGLAIALHGKPPARSETMSAKKTMAAKKTISVQQPAPQQSSTLQAVSRASVIQNLQQSIRGLETAGRIDDGALVSGGCPAIDFALPDGGYRRGTLVEWITTRSISGGSGADYLSLRTAWNACQAGEALVIVDPHSQFYPPAATAMGIQFANTILLRPGTTDPNELFWSIDQALRCEAVGAVWGILDSIGERWFRRFQLSAESSGALGLFVRPATALKSPSWAEVQWKWRPRPTLESPSIRICDMKLHRCRGGRTGGVVRVEIDTVTGVLQGKRMSVDYGHRNASNSRNKHLKNWNPKPTG